MASNDNMIAALLREREGYARRGLKDRVSQVDEQLEHYGYTADNEADGPKGRTAPPQQTAAADPAAGTGKGEAKPPAKKTPAKKTAEPATPPASASDQLTPPAE